MRKILSTILVLLSLSILPALLLTAQSTGKTVRKHRQSPPVDHESATTVDQAEDALSKSNLSLAETLLRKATKENPKDYRAWFDIGYVYRSTKRPTDAIDAYHRSLVLKPDVFESNLDLGQLLAIAGQTKQAMPFLEAATKLTPSSNKQDNLARAWNALGAALRTENPNSDVALDAFRHAIAFNSKDPVPHLGAGQILEAQKHFREAEGEYKSALNLDPDSRDAISGLANVYMQTSRLGEAESQLREYLKKDPANASAHLQLARALRANGNNDAAIGELQEALKTSPQDTDLLRELASLYAATQHFDEAANLYQSIVISSPSDAALRHEYGIVLIHAKRFGQAESELLEALKINPKLATAYGDLALAAHENKHYGLTIQALNARAKLIPDEPGAYFLRATAYDNLKSYKEAVENYHQFLNTSAGKYPEQEWQARHRLIAIDPNAKKK